MTHPTLDFTPVIQAQEISRKTVQRQAKKILKKAAVMDSPLSDKFSLRSMRNVSDIYELAGYLYVLEEYELCYAVCNILDGVSFSGNYDIWDFVGTCRTMKCAIDRMYGREEVAQQMLESVYPYEAPELYGNVWASIWKTANELEQWWQDVKDKKRSARSVRFCTLGICMDFNHYLQLNAMSEHQETMRQWKAKWIEFLRREMP